MSSDELAKRLQVLEDERADSGPLAERGVDFLVRQVGSVAGGTTEMSRSPGSRREPS
jgi:hypothetical protein